MNESQLLGRLSWLTARLAVRRNNINSFLLRLRGIAARAGTSMALHKKFMYFMDQVYDDKEKELALILKIEQIEKRHQELKKANRLRQVDAKLRARYDDVVLDASKEEQPKRLGLLSLLGLLYLFSSKAVKHKNQALTND